MWQLRQVAKWVPDFWDLVADGHAECIRERLERYSENSEIVFGPKARQSSGIKRGITLAAAEKDLGSFSCSHGLMAH